jgi:hypothetical protein
MAYSGHGTQAPLRNPACDPERTSWAQTGEPKAANALQIGVFGPDAVTPSLPAIQHRQQEIVICRSFRALRPRTVDPLLTMRSFRQLVATHGNGYGLFRPLRRSVDLRLIATGCNHGAP